MSWTRILTLALTLAASSHSAFARPKTDIVIMKNGDRFTCEVKSLQYGVLKVDIDYVDGTISIDWLRVARVESEASFLVQLQDGSIYSTKLVNFETTTPVKIELQPEGESPVTVEKTSVVRMTETSDTFRQRLEGNLTLGSTYSKGNHATQYNIGSELGYRESRWGAKATYNSNLSSSTGANTATRNQVDLISYRMLRYTNFFFAGTGGYLQSSVQGIQNQESLGGGVGWFLKNTNRVYWPVLAGAGWQGTNYSPTATVERVQNIAVMLISSNLQTFVFKKTQLNINGNLAPALTDSGRVFAKLNVAYYLKVFGKIDWNLSMYGSWDSRPPGHLSGSDYGTSTGLSYSFGNKW